MILARWPGLSAALFVLTTVGCERPSAPPVLDAVPVPKSENVPDVTTATEALASPPEAITLIDVSAVEKLNPRPEAEATPSKVTETVMPTSEISPQPASKSAAEPFARCQSCHSVQPGGEHGVGPNLFRIVGQRVGSQSNYAYSSAMSSFDQTWSPQLLSLFLENPRGVIPGTKMMAGPVRDPEVREAIIAYLSKD